MYKWCLRTTIFHITNTISKCVSYIPKETVYAIYMRVQHKDIAYIVSCGILYVFVILGYSYCVLDISVSYHPVHAIYQHEIQDADELILHRINLDCFYIVLYIIGRIYFLGHGY